MRHSIALIATSAFVLFSSLAQAGGLSDEVMEAPVVVVEEEPAPAGSSISPTFIIVGVLAALLIAAAVAANDDDDDDDEDDTVLTSDMRLKEDITQLGVTDNGLTLYSFRYIGDDQLYSGVMAQEVLLHTPKAVVMQPNGYLAVRYDMLGLQMEKLN